MKMRQGDISKVKAELLKTNTYCPLCNTPFSKIESKNICLDHCHTSGFVRDLLCRNCNGNLGRLEGLATRSKKSLTMLGWLSNAVKFLEFHKIPRTDWIHPKHKSEEEKRELRNKRARTARAKRKEVTNG